MAADQRLKVARRSRSRLPQLAATMAASFQRAAGSKEGAAVAASSRNNSAATTSEAEGDRRRAEVGVLLWLATMHAGAMLAG